MSDKVAKKSVSVVLTAPYLECLNRLVEERLFVNRSETIKNALRCLFRKYEMEPFMKPLEEKEGDSLSEDELTERIDALKDSEAKIRTERQSLEKQLRNIKRERLQGKGDEG